MNKKRVWFGSILAAAMLFSSCGVSNNAGASVASQAEETTVPASSFIQEPSPTPVPEPVVSRVSFSATGDNLIHDGIYKQAQRRAGGTGYDFSFCYAQMKDFYAEHDLNWLNQETLITDTLSPSSYPSFSTPGEMGRTLYDMGIRVFSVSNNHTYDKGANGIQETMAYWDAMPDDVLMCGLYTNEDEQNGVNLKTVNGITFAFLSYTQYTNGIPTPSNASAQVIYTSETNRMQEQIQKARQLADFVIVGCHWGIEDAHQITQEQRDLANQLANWGADLIVGTHPHVVQSCERLTAEDGRSAFVAYSLGNFISAQSRPDELIGALLETTFEKTEFPDGETEIRMESPVFVPVVTHYDMGYSNIHVRPFSQYTEEQALSHGVRAAYPQFDYEYITQVLGDNFPPEFLTLE